MRKLSIYTLLGVLALVFFKLGCSDINSTNPVLKIDGIQSVIPATGGYGTRVVIGGHGFEPLQKITFNGTEAVAEMVNDSVIVTRVPKNATTGPIELIAKGEPLVGPRFTVNTELSEILSISSIDPSKAYQLDTVKISGSGFVDGNSSSTQNKNVSEDAKLISEPDLNDKSDISIKDEFFGDKRNQPLPKAQHDNTADNKKEKFADDEVSVYFNEIEGGILSRNDSVILATVPLGAQSGLISIVAAADTVVGPNFEILDHSITNISPTTGLAGTEVTITGVDFSPNPQKNIVKFDGKVATVQSATETELVVIAPDGVSTGLVSVTINTIEKTGPEFTVQQASKTLVVNVESVNASSGHDGYNLKVSGQTDRWIYPNGSETFTDITDTEVTIELEQGPQSCEIQGQNPRTVTLGSGVTEVDFVVHCYPSISNISPDSAQVGDTVTVSGSGFNSIPANNKFYFSGLSEDIEATIVEATGYRLEVIVPNGAATGPVRVSSMGLSKTGPEFTILEATKTLVVNVESVNASSGHDGYNLKVSGQSDRWIYPNGTETFTDLTDTQVIIELEQGPQSCEIQGQNPRTVTLGSGTTEVDYVVHCYPSISNISPDSAQVGDTVTVSGSGFNSIPANNKFYFSETSGEVEATIVESSQWTLKVIVPSGAKTGATRVTSMGLSKTGPEFTILEATKTLVVNVESVNASSGHDGYNLKVSGQSDRWIYPNGTETFTDLTDTQVTIELEQGPQSCEIQGQNPRTVTLGSGTTEVDYVVHCYPSISNISPDSAQVGDTVTVSGSGFNSIPANNKFYFSGLSEDIEATIVEATGYRLEVIVPNGAATGPVRVSSMGLSATGPEFTVQQASKTLVVNVESVNASSGHDGYNLKVSGQTDRWIYPNGTETFTDLTDTQVTIELEQGPQSCEIQGQNPRTVTLGSGTTEVDYVVHCYPSISNISPDSAQVGDTVTVSGSGFNSIPANNKFYFSETSGEVEATIVESSQWTLKVIVPSGAKTGATRVTSMDLSATGPEFTVVEGVESLSDKLVYSSQTVDNEGYITDKYEIFKHNEADSYSPTQLTDSPGNKYGPVISPDGLQIAYYVELGAESHIHVINANGSNVTRLITDGYNQDPTWNPDGTKLMFSRAADSLTHPDLYVYDLSNGQLQNITNTAGVSELSPSWSTTNKIAFTSTDSLPNASSTGISEIVTMNPDGTGKTTIKTSSLGLYTPAWSPDASKIAFVEDVLRSGYKYTNMFIMDSNGANIFQPPYYSGVEIDPTWSPDGEKIIYSMKDDGMILSIYNILTNSSGNSIWGSGNLLQASWGRN